jgi:hypothetical protein
MPLSVLSGSSSSPVEFLQRAVFQRLAHIH